MKVAAESGVGEALSVIGRPSCLVFRTTDAGGTPGQAMRTLFLQEILRRGVLGQSFVVSAAHSDRDIEQTVEAARGATVAYRKALESGRPEDLLASCGADGREQRVPLDGVSRCTPRSN